MTHILMPLSDVQLKQLESVTQDLSTQQLAWLSGYLWSRAQLTNGSVDPTQQRGIILSPTAGQTLPAITLISASQTGNARSVAEQLSQDLDRGGFSVNLYRAAEYKFKQIAQEKLLVVVISTQGEGQEPEEAAALFKFLFSKKAPSLTQTQFAVLALGDSSYEFFCQAGKRIDERLAELGATRLLERVDADVNFQQTADDWRQSVVSYFSQQVTLPTVASEKSQPIAVESSMFNKQQPFTASLLVNQKITSRDSLKDIRHLEIDLSGANLRYQPGDALGVWYHNDPALVAEMLDAVSLPADSQININNEAFTIEQALIRRYELTQNTPPIATQYAQLSQHNELQAIVADKSRLQQFVSTVPPVDMFKRYPAKLSAQQLSSLLRPLTPRLYSIASSQEEVGDEVHLTVGRVSYLIDGQARQGGGSGFLAALNEDDPLDVFIEHNDLFRLPADGTTDIIMIGSGTGIAPFRAFMQQRAADGAKGKNWLIFGNQHFTSDFLYQVEWQSYYKQGLLTRIDLAWSRDQQQKIYVQDKLLDNAVDVWQWLMNGAAIYVCGDARGMAKQVDQALQTLIMQQGQMSAEQADDFIIELRSQQRYQRDIY